jgi:hypothetical protein
MTTLGSSTTASFMGVWLFEGSDSTAWISNNSPNSIELSGLTEGLSFIRLTRLQRDNASCGTGFTTWGVGNGKGNEFTYGDDPHNRTITNKLAGGISTMYTERGYLRRFKKVHNRGTADNVYLFNRYSATGYELFYNSSLSSKKYVPVLLTNVDFIWNEQTNLKTLANLTVKEIWKT